MWWDEVFTVAVARMPFPNWLSYLFWNDRAQTPGFFALISLWELLGDNEFMVRYVSVMCGTLSIPLIYIVGRRIGGPKVGILSAALLAFSPFHLWYSQEARVYAVEALYGLLSIYLFLRVFEKPCWREALVLAVANCIGLYFHYLFVLVILGQLTFLVLMHAQSPRSLRYGVAANALAGIGFFPWLAAAMATGGFTASGIDWIPPARWYDPVLSFYTLLLGSTNNPRDPLNWLTPVIAISLIVYALRKMETPWQKAAATYLVLALIVPVGVIFLVSLPFVAAKRSIYVDRYMAAQLAPLLILIALGARRLAGASPRLATFGAALAVIPLFLSAWNMYSDRTFARDDYRGIGAYIAIHSDQSRDQLAIEASATLAYSHYDRVGLNQITFSPNDVSLESKVDRVLQSGIPTRLWLLTATLPRDAHGFMPTVDERIASARHDSAKRLLDARFQAEGEYLFPGYMLTLYQTFP